MGQVCGEMTALQNRQGLPVDEMNSIMKAQRWLGVEANHPQEE